MAVTYDAHRGSQHLCLSIALGLSWPKRAFYRPMVAIASKVRSSLRLRPVWLVAKPNWPIRFIPPTPECLWASRSKERRDLGAPPGCQGRQLACPAVNTDQFVYPDEVSKPTACCFGPKPVVASQQFPRTLKGLKTSSMAVGVVFTERNPRHQLMVFRFCRFRLTRTRLWLRPKAAN